MEKEFADHIILVMQEAGTNINSVEDFVRIYNSRFLLKTMINLASKCDEKELKWQFRKLF
jgi:hypothetical protein